jgi:outer membrane receptor for ferrienterochelin and colicins
VRYIYTLFIFFSTLGSLRSQEDSTWNKMLDETIVTATRSDRKWSSLPMPVTVIKKEQIRQMGALRLNDVLAEQTGLLMVNDHGSGVQVQGFDPDYTLILVDGEPLIGRTSGTLDLSRIAVGNIKQIEVVKGPSSSLYGSEALAGVINIITDKSNGTNADLSLRYGSNNTVDVSLGSQFKKGGLSAVFFVNRYSSGGYDLNLEQPGATVSPFENYTIQPKLAYAFSPKTSLTLNARISDESQDAWANIGTSDVPDIVAGISTLKDFNFNPTFKTSVSDKIKLTARYYVSNYQTNNILNKESDNSVYDETFFRQTFRRPEIQTDVVLSENQFLIFGIGMVDESVEATRYEGTKRYNTKYAFLQHEFFLKSKTQFITGLRYDAHNAYRNQFSPKFSVSHELNDTFTLRGSAGVGYKAPDFRQLFLNFTNSVAGYSVFGSQEVNQRLAELQRDNQIINVLIDTSTFGDLSPESSLAVNLGGVMKLKSGYLATVNLFRNDIRNLIETQPVARKTNGQNVFSYQNLREVFTQGAELDINKKFEVNKSAFNVSVGYQYLEAKDRSVLEKLEEGNVFRRNPVTLETERVQKSDYFGLMGRSKHSANAKVFYTSKSGFSASLRTIYRGKYGFGDLNGNNIADAENEFVKGYLLVNTSVGYNLKQWDFQAGVDNLTNFRNPQFIPTLPGQLFWTTIRYRISQLKS